MRNAGISYEIETNDEPTFGTIARVQVDRVLVDVLLHAFAERGLRAVGANCRHSRECFREVREYGRLGRRVESSQLACARHVVSLFNYLITIVSDVYYRI